MDYFDRQNELVDTFWDEDERLAEGARRLGLDNETYEKLSVDHESEPFVERPVEFGPPKPSPTEIRAFRQAEVINAASDALRSELMRWGMTEDDARWMISDSYRRD